MDAVKWRTLKFIVVGVAKTILEGRHSTSDEWEDIAAELQRAADIADEESKRLWENEQRERHRGRVKS